MVYLWISFLVFYQFIYFVRFEFCVCEIEFCFKNEFFVQCYIYVCDCSVGVYLFYIGWYFIINCYQFLRFELFKCYQFILFYDFVFLFFIVVIFYYIDFIYNGQGYLFVYLNSNVYVILCDFNFLVIQ